MMKCPKCGTETDALRFVDDGGVCRECAHGVFTEEESLNSAAMTAYAVENNSGAAIVQNRVKPTRKIDAEEAIQERIGILEWLFFFAVIVWCWCYDRIADVRAWFAMQHVCSWCKRWLAGNPMARAKSDHICDRCLHKHFPRYIGTDLSRGAHNNTGPVSSGSSPNLLGRSGPASAAAVFATHKQTND